MTHTVRGQIAVPSAPSSLSSYQNASNRNRANIEEGLRMGEDFPFVCDRCLGNNPYLRMIKLPNHDACKLTGRPFTVFKWRPSRKSPLFNKTICCYEIAAEKNICQCCLNDLTFGVPVALRDAFMRSQNTLASQQMNDMPSSETNQAYYFQQKLANKNNKLLIADGQEQRDASQQLLDVAREFKERQQMEHEREEDEILSERKAKKMKTSNQPLIEARPEDETISTLFLSNIPNIDENEVKKVMQPFGEVIRIYMLVEKNSCFVEFSTREEAEIAAFNLNSKIFFGNNKVRVAWAFQNDPYHNRPENNRVGQKKSTLEATEVPKNWQLFPGFKFPKKTVIFSEDSELSQEELARIQASNLFRKQRLNIDKAAFDKISFK